MFPEIQQIAENTARRGELSIAARQAPLVHQYKKSPETAWIIDTAVTSSHQISACEPLYSHVDVQSNTSYGLPVAVHKAVGGESELPTPGHIFAAAIASCMDSSIKMIANHLEIGIRNLQVKVQLGIDVRGTLRLDENTPIGFQVAIINIALICDDGVGEAIKSRLLIQAEKSCILLQTLYHPPEIQISNRTLI